MGRGLHQVGMLATGPYLDWLSSLSEASGIPRTHLIERGLRRMAEELGHEPPPNRSVDHRSNRCREAAA